MNGYLLDENIPRRLQFALSSAVFHSRDLGERLSDEALWKYARAHDLVIVSKDADFAERILTSEPPPRIIHLRFGNLRRAEFHSFLRRIWPRVEILLPSSKLINLYADTIQAFS